MTTTQPPGLWIAIGNWRRENAVEQSIARDERFSTVVIAHDVRPKDAELAVVSINGTEVDYLAISQKGKRVATGQVTIVISNLIPLAKASVDDIRALLPKRFRSLFYPAESDVSRISPRLWQEVLKVILQDDARVADGVKELRHMIANSRMRRGRREGGFEVFERDAVGTSIQTWGGIALRKRVLRKANPRYSTPVAPFLSQLKDVTVREDPFINHDAMTFPSLEIARKDIVGSVVLGDPLGEEYLTILNCNRQPLERTLGVDLIYYTHRYDSFVLVQYKRMKANSDGVPEYRPGSDRSHTEELKRMVATERTLKTLPQVRPSGDTSEFRLSRRPFYMKLCESKAKAALDSGMVAGMYIPLGLWRRQLKAPATRGPKGGVVMSWDNCKRRFNNGEFTSLLRHGWIGSAPGQSRRLSAIIESVLGSGRMLVLAVTSTSPTPPDFRRDGWGRFASRDDPDGSV